MTEESLRLDVKQCLINPLVGNLEDPLNVEFTFRLNKSVSDVFWEIQYSIDCLMENMTNKKMEKSEKRKDPNFAEDEDQNNLDFDPMQIIGSTENTDYKQDQDHKIYFHVNKFNLSSNIPIGRLTNCGILKFVLKRKTTNDSITDFQLVLQINEDRIDGMADGISNEEKTTADLKNHDLHELGKDSDLNCTSSIGEKSTMEIDSNLSHAQRRQKLKRVIYHIFP